MDGLVAYILARKLVAGAASGISNIVLNGNVLEFQFKDGTSASMTIPLPEDGKDGEDGNDGVSVTDIAVNDSGHLICSLSNGTSVDAGEIPTSIIFVKNTDELPIKGQISTLYVAGTSIYIWTGSEYASISTGSDGGGEGGSMQWGSF